ncbi:MAG: Gfo/Idh/MocA family oxidoreductase [bacterium]
MSPPEITKKGIGIAVAGCGYWGPKLVRVLCANKRCGRVFLWDKCRERMAKVAKDYPGTVCTAGFGEIFKNPGIRALVVATPPFSHYHIASEALKNGRHVLVEKPLALSCIQAENLIREAQARRLVLMAGHTYLYNQRVRKIKRLIDMNCLGRLRMMNFMRFGLIPALTRKPEIGVLWDYAVHDISILLYWLERMPLKISARALGLPLCGGPDDGIHLRLEFPGDLIVSVRASRVPRDKTRLIILNGTAGTIFYNDLECDAPIKIFLRKDFLTPKIADREPLSDECDDFMRSIERSGSCFCDGYSALRVLKILEAAEKSLRTHGKAVPLSND